MLGQPHFSDSPLIGQPESMIDPSIARGHSPLRYANDSCPWTQFEGHRQECRAETIAHKEPVPARPAQDQNCGPVTTRVALHFLGRAPQRIANRFYITMISFLLCFFFGKCLLSQPYHSGLGKMFAASGEACNAKVKLTVGGTQPTVQISRGHIHSALQ